MGKKNAMQKLLFLVLLFSPLIGFSQKIDGIPLDSLNAKYISLIGVQRGLSYNEIKINVDYGQKREFLNEKVSMRLFDDAGNIVVFNSMIGALNYFTNYGYILHDAYVINNAGQNVYNWILIKKE